MPTLENSFVPTNPTPEPGGSVYEEGDVTAQTPTAATANIDEIYRPADASTLNYTDPFYPTTQPAALPAPKPCFLGCTYHSTCHIARASCPHEPPPPRQEAKLSIG